LVAELEGGMLFHDAQVYNSERLLLSFAKSAQEKGAVLANYVKVTGFLQNGETVPFAETPTNFR